MRAKSIRRMITARLAQTPSALPPRSLNPAAVLVPIVTRREPSVILTRRTDSMPSHGGQICFPGGRFHDLDETLTATALRETEEETGISPELVEILGYLEAYRTTSNYTVLPVVGLLQEGFTLAPNQSEVAEIFEVPLAFLVDPANTQLQMVERDGIVRPVHTITYGSHVIWGATAGMIVTLSKRLQER